MKTFITIAKDKLTRQELKQIYELAREAGYTHVQWDKNKLPKHTIPIITAIKALEPKQEFTREQVINIIRKWYNTEVPMPDTVEKWFEENF